jgi:hypothetical protein
MTTQEFITKLTPENAELVTKMQAVKAPEEAYAVARETGVTDSFEDFVAGMTAFYNEIKDLSEDDLELVAGGRLSDTEMTGLSMVTAASTALGTATVSAIVVTAVGLAV